MTTGSALHRAPGLRRLSDGTLGWLVRHLDDFDPFARRGPAPGRAAREPDGAHRPAKAALELALLTHCWAGLDADEVFALDVEGQLVAVDDRL
ncbi:hypothetical protein ACFXAM_08635, partial [Kitasatospora sp. NPDC059462]